MSSARLAAIAAVSTAGYCSVRYQRKYAGFLTEGRWMADRRSPAPLEPAARLFSSSLGEG
ncbi:hypothetical protein AB3R30_06185 [Leptolyngbyaceae cyanobacterium UHCC 1019]